MFELGCGAGVAYFPSRDSPFSHPIELGHRGRFLHFRDYRGVVAFGKSRTA